MLIQIFTLGYEVVHGTCVYQSLEYAFVYFLCVQTLTKVCKIVKWRCLASSHDGFNRAFPNTAHGPETINHGTVLGTKSKLTFVDRRRQQVQLHPPDLIDEDHDTVNILHIRR